jgi:flagellar M-ring protein FliF
MASVGEQIKSVFGRLSLSQKVFFTSVILIVLAGLIGLIMWANTPNYSILFSNLQDQDTSLIIQKLKDMKVSYKITGSTIRVPEDKVNELRITLAAQGLPRGAGIGFEIFDKSKIGTTEFVEQINYVRALEGELSRTISSINEVKSAKVHLVLPKKSVFLEEREPAKASIILNVLPGAGLSNSVIGAITHLVASSVEGLEPQNITVVDIYGRLLASPTSNSEDAELTNSQIDIQKKVSNRLSKQVTALLEPIVGIGKVRVNVKAELDFTKKEKVDEIYDPNVQIERSEQKETQKTSEVMQGGTPGVGSNVAGNTSQTASNTPGRISEKKKETKNYEINKSVLKTIFPTGGIKKLSVAVIVDDKVKEEEKNGKIIKTKTPRTVAELNKLKKLVIASIGIDENRGDIIEVANMPFSEVNIKEAEQYIKNKQQKEFIKIIIKYAVILILSLILIFMVLKPMVKKVTVAIEKESKRSITVGEISGEELPPSIEEEHERKMLEKEIESKFKQSPEAKKLEILRDKLAEFASEKTDDLVGVIKSMMME